MSGNNGHVAEVRPAELSVAEQNRRENFEKIFRNCLKSQIEFGRSLRDFRDAKLYRSTHGTFEEYCVDALDMSERRVYELIAAADVIDSLEENCANGAVLPTNERQVRPLTRLPADKREAAWKEAVETAPKGKVTAAHVEKVVETRLPPESRKSKPDKEDDEPKAPVLSKGEEEGKAVRDEFMAQLAKVLDGGCYTSDALCEAVAVGKTSIHWWIRMCEISPAVIVHRNYGAKGLTQYTFQPTQCVTAHERIRQLAEQIATDPAGGAKAHSAASKILSLLGG